MTLQQRSEDVERLVIPGEMYRTIREVELMCEAFRMVPFNEDYARALSVAANWLAIRSAKLSKVLSERIERGSEGEEAEYE